MTLITFSDKTFVRANSHRAYQRLFALVGGKENAPAYYSAKTFGDNSKGYYLVENSFLEDALKIKGISKPKSQYTEDYRLCWNWK